MGPIELLRQFIDQKGWYELKRRSFLEIVNVQLIAAMSTLQGDSGNSGDNGDIGTGGSAGGGGGGGGGGGNHVTPRFLRHLNVLHFSPLGSQSIFQVFTALGDTWMGVRGGTGRGEGGEGGDGEEGIIGFSSAARGILKDVVMASIDVYQKVKATLLPTPAQPHYSFNLRDLAVAFTGVCRAAPAAVPEPINVVRLWAHEQHRVFGDRYKTTY